MATVEQFKRVLFKSFTKKADVYIFKKENKLITENYTKVLKYKGVSCNLIFNHSRINGKKNIPEVDVEILLLFSNEYDIPKNSEIFIDGVRYIASTQAIKFTTHQEIVLKGAENV